MALDYAARGIAVFPVSRNKRPYSRLTPNGFKDATTDASQIRQWWSTYPRAMIAAPTNEFTVIDIDSHKADEDSIKETAKALKMIFGDRCPAPKVKTASGGYHLYFKSTDSCARRIRALPNIDILGGFNTGYVLLPDERTYRSMGENKLIDVISDLPVLPVDRLDAAIRAFAKTVPAAQQSQQKAPKRSPGAAEKVYVHRPLTDASDPRLAGLKLPPGFIKEAELSPRDTRYRKTSVTPSVDDQFVEDRLNTESMVLLLEQSELNPGRINALFHNPYIQSHLTKFLGLLPPTFMKNEPQKSVLPGHHDKNPSMGTRWSEDGSHIIIRDFSNKFSGETEGNDYNVVSLFAAMRYGKMPPRLNKPEFTTWFVKMMIESGIINAAKFMTRFKNSLPTESKYSKFLYEVLILQVVKTLYDGGDDGLILSCKFVAAWVETSVSTARRMTIKAVTDGYLRTTGTFRSAFGKNSTVYEIV